MSTEVSQTTAEAERSIALRAAETIGGSALLGVSLSELNQRDSSGEESLITVQTGSMADRYLTTGDLVPLGGILLGGALIADGLLRRTKLFGR